MNSILFIIDGAFGTGKKQLVEYIRSNQKRTRDSMVLQKETAVDHTHVVSKAISSDLNSPISNEQFDHMIGDVNDKFYYYRYTKQRYGFYKSSLDKALQEKKYVFVIVRDKDTIRNLRDEYKEFLAVPVYIYTDEKELVRGLKGNCIPEEDIEFHRNRQQQAWNDYLADPGFYRLVAHTSDEREFYRRIDSLINEFSSVPMNELRISYSESFRLINQLVGYKQRIEQQIQRYPYNKNVFLMMRFRNCNDDIYRTIRQILEHAGLNCARADQTDWRITGDIYNATAVMYCCKFGIALFDECIGDNDCKEPNEYNPNVAYELGMMHLQEKDCLILRHSSLSKMPIDIDVRLRHDYKNRGELEAIIQGWIKGL